MAGHKSPAERLALYHLFTGLLCSLVSIDVLSEPDKLEHVSVRAKESRNSWNRDNSLLGAALTPRDLAAPVVNVAAMAQQQPGVAYAGQGGLLQTLSIRGLSGQQVANYWGDLQILSDRRAGTASSFIDPLMLGSVEILRGPASVFYGNGAGAGVLQLSPARPESAAWQLQWGSAGDENLQYLALANEDLSLAVSRRSADDSSTPSGQRLHSRFEQYNAQLLWNTDIAGRPFEFRQLLSEGRDIGKSNNQFPDRVTDYPHEKHWLGQLSGNIPGEIDSSVYYHYQELDTRVERVGESVNEVQSKSFDWGARFTREINAGQFPLRLGLEYFGRRNVKADERETSLASGLSANQQTLDAEQDGVDLFIDGHRQFATVELAGGVRWAWQEQRAAGQSAEDDWAVSTFVRGSWHPVNSLDVSLEIANGTRFAGLSERFFFGTTGRGQVLGNASLDPEDTLGIDLGLLWVDERGALELHAFGMSIDNYIERFNVTEDLRSYENLTKGKIYGLEAAARINLNKTWSLQMGGHYLESEDNDGETLANAMPPRLFSQLRFSQGQWRADARFEYRFSEDDVAPGEVPVDSAQLLTASISHAWDNGLTVRLWGENLLDEGWRLGSDELATDAPERSFGMTLSWQRDPPGYK